MHWMAHTRVTIVLLLHNTTPVLLADLDNDTKNMPCMLTPTEMPWSLSGTTNIFSGIDSGDTARI
jgi:MinD superfamily P-loop ATPase